MDCRATLSMNRLLLLAVGCGLLVGRTSVRHGRLKSALQKPEPANTRFKGSVRYRAGFGGLAMTNGLLQLRKKHAGKTKAAEVAHAHRVQFADQMVALMLYHPRVKTFHRALNRVSILVKSGVTNARETWHHTAQ